MRPAMQLVAPEQGDGVLNGFMSVISTGLAENKIWQIMNCPAFSPYQQSLWVFIAHAVQNESQSCSSRQLLPPAHRACDHPLAGVVR